MASRWVCDAHPEVELKSTADAIVHEQRNKDCRCRLEGDEDLMAKLEMSLGPTRDRHG